MIIVRILVFVGWKVSIKALLQSFEKMTPKIEFPSLNIVTSASLSKSWTTSNSLNFASELVWIAMSKEALTLRFKNLMSPIVLLLMLASANWWIYPWCILNSLLFEPSKFNHQVNHINCLSTLWTPLEAIGCAQAILFTLWPILGLKLSSWKLLLREVLSSGLYPKSLRFLRSFALMTVGLCSFTQFANSKLRKCFFRCLQIAGMAPHRRRPIDQRIDVAIPPGNLKLNFSNWNLA